MPPASLPATPAMRPGPRTARNGARRRTRTGARGRGTCGARMRGRGPSRMPGTTPGRTRDRRPADCGTGEPPPWACRRRACRRPRQRHRCRRPRRRRSRHVGSAPQPPDRPKTRGRRRFQFTGRTVSIASSTVTMPSSRPSSADDRDREQVVACDERRDLGLGREHPDHDRLPDHELAQPGTRPGHDEVAQREHAHESALRVGDVEVVDRLRVRLELAQSLDGLRGRELLRDGDELGGHDAARGVLGIRQQVAQLLRLVGLHEGQDLGTRLV